jgi:UDP-N-acetylmuramate dehydrogenase
VPTFADLTTLRVGGPIGEYVEVTTYGELIDAMFAADDAGREVLVVGGGSNLLVSDDGFDGVVIRPMLTGVTRLGSMWWFGAGQEWDDAVRTTVQSGHSGLEALSGIPGTVGGAPIQNVGAYGALTSDVLSQVQVFDRVTNEVEWWSPEQCEFGPHRSSIFKHSHRWVILSVQFRLDEKPRSAVRYQSLADSLGVALGEEVETAAIRDAVLALRRSRGMVLDEDDHDTWSVGSFFLNPVLAEVPAAANGCPAWPDPTGTKLSAAWLIENAGFPKGYGNDRVSLSTKHTLAITNRGTATASDVLALAREVRDGVSERFAVTLEPECHLINCSL